MNFTREIKRELVKTPPAERGERLALLSALLQTGGELRPDGFTYTGEDEETAQLLMSLAEQLFGEPLTVAGAAKDPKSGRDKLTLSRTGDCGALLRSRTRTEAEKIAYIKGAFLGGGSCTLPRAGAKTGYHLEIVFPARRDAERLLRRFGELQLLGSVIGRGDRTVVYMKSRESISDFLSVLGADAALAKLSGITAAREERNQENRVLNCYQGNADKAAIASAEQVLALEKLQKSGKLLTLGEPLRTTALARLENPVLSLSELAALLGISKGGLSHRLRKILSLARATDES